MIRLPTAVLHHQTATDSHYDWLVGNPHDPQGRLWTARLDVPSVHWLSRGKLLLRELPPHRRVYLTYQGPIAGQRGMVRRIDQGWHHAALWTANRSILHLCMRDFTGIVQLRRVTEHDWVACVGP